MRILEIKYVFVLQSGIVNAEITAFGCLRDAVILPLIDQLRELLLLIEEHGLRSTMNSNTEVSSVVLSYVNQREL